MSRKISSGDKAGESTGERARPGSAQPAPTPADTSGSRDRGWLATLYPWALIGGLVLFHAVNNWRWLAENVTLTGWDRPRHLAISLSYARTLSTVTIQSLFNVMVSDPIRPPLFPASATPLYWLFGWSSDVATMVNVGYMAVALAATYGIGRRWGGRRLGLLSATLLALFPMFYAMSRYFYIEFALMAMVALTVYLLLATDGFRRWGVSLLFGLALGLGLLTKRTFIVFAVGPLLVALLASGLWPALRQRLQRRPRIYWQRAALAVLGGLALAATWFFPNREMARTLILGDALLFIWWALAAWTLYFISLPPAPLSNATSALSLGGTIASAWYLARVEFIQRMMLYGYGVNDPRGRALDLDNLVPYLYYIRKLANEHLSLTFFVLLLAAVVAAVVVYGWRQGFRQQALRQVRLEGWAVVAWVVGAWLLLTFSIYQETRAFTPVLPAVALIFGACLLKLPWRWLRAALLAFLLAFGLLQFCILSYEPIHRLLPPRIFTLPFWGQTSLIAQGNYLDLPDEGPTDQGYWVQPDILQRIEEQRLALGRESMSLGLLARTRQINTGAFIYLILVDYPHLRVEALLEPMDQTTPYSSLFDHDYVAVKRVNSGAKPIQEQLIGGILGGAERVFDQAFELETCYPLPDGDSLYLYRQRYHLPADYPVEYVTHLAKTLGDRTRAGDAILVTPPALGSLFIANYTGPATVLLLPASEEEWAEVGAHHRRLFMVVGDAQAGQIEGQPARWLDGHAFRATHEWAGSLQLLTYGTAAAPLAIAPTTKTEASFGGQIGLAGYDLPAGIWHPGDILPLTLFWQRLAAIDGDWAVFVHLLDSNGQLIAQTDSTPAGGLRPTSGWTEGEQIVDRHGLALPDPMPPGTFELRVGLYLPATGERQPVTGMRADSLSLGQVKVAEP